MLSIVLFVEDSAHQLVVEALIRRVASELGKEIDVRVGSAHGGRPRVASEFKLFLKDLKLRADLRPDAVVVATDANCAGLVERRREFDGLDPSCPLLLAIPDPHVERWLLLDGAAFKAVFERGCDAPDNKCERDRYKEQLRRAIRAAGVTPSLGGIEFAADIVDEMDLDRVSSVDASFGRFVTDLRRWLQSA